MNFQFDNVSGMLHMAGHGIYVWTAVLVTLALIAWLIINPLLQRVMLLKRLLKTLLVSSCAKMPVERVSNAPTA